MEYLSKKLNENVDNFKNIFKDCGDISFRFIEIGNDKKLQACLIFSDGLIDKYLLSEKNREILISIAEKIDENFDVTCYDKSLANNVAVLYDEAKTIYISLKKTSS